MKYFKAVLLLLSLAAATTAYAGDDKNEKGGDKSPSKPPSSPGKEPSKPPSSPGKEPTKGGGKGDPIMSGFDGRDFEFIGQAGSIYNVISEKNHQLSMKLKEGHMWDHEGSFVAELGFQYSSGSEQHTVHVANKADSLVVSLDGEELKLREGETEVEHILGMASGEMQLLWQLHRTDYGNAVEITTELLNILLWVTPAGTRDEGGKVQPAYLNFDVSLLSSPAHNALEGIIGRTFDASAVEENDFKFHGAEADYELASFFDRAGATCLLGKTSHVNRARKLIASGARTTLPARAGFARKFEAAL